MSKSDLKTTFSSARRVLYTMLAALLVVATLPLLQSGKADALQLQSRSIKMSDSGISSNATVPSGIGSGSGVTYLVTFTTSATGATGSMVIDFCSTDPLIGDTCTAPTGMSASGAALNAAAVSGTVQTGTDNWAVTASAHQVKLADDNTAGAHPTHDMQASTTESFALSGITNPSTLGTFYARIVTYSGNSWGTYTSPTVPGNYVDYGGVALATTNPITITARVQEQLEFCVTALDPNGGTPWSPAPTATANGCAATNLTYPSITIGHGSPTLILDSTATDTAPVFTDLSTNATHGAIIDMRASNTACADAGGLSADNDTTCAIPPVNAGTPGPSAMPAGTAAFGLWCGTDAVAGAGTTGSINCDSDYNDGTHTPATPPIYYSMDTSGANGSVAGTYGSTVATTAAPCYNAVDEFDFGATASLTTPAGIYSGNETLIATGTF